MDILQSTFGHIINKTKYNNVYNHIYYLDELKTLENNNIIKYYTYIINNVKLNNNINNSYIMWIVNKTQEIDINKPCNLIQGRYSMPDIDCDFEARSRDDVIEYITQKYGKSNVAQIATYGTLMGRAALKAIFRTDNDVSFAEQNEITKLIPDKAKISDELQNMKNSGEEASVIKWTLLNKRKHLEQWCYLEDGKLEGPLAEKFKKAIKLEGVISTRSRHAAGVVIGPSALKKLVPLILDEKNNKPMIGCQMGDLDEIGLLKMDILGLTNLDKIKDINEL